MFRVRLRHALRAISESNSNNCYTLFHIVTLCCISYRNPELWEGVRKIRHAEYQSHLSLHSLWPGQPTRCAAPCPGSQVSQVSAQAGMERPVILAAVHVSWHAQQTHQGPLPGRLLLIRVVDVVVDGGGGGYGGGLAGMEKLVILAAVHVSWHAQQAHQGPLSGGWLLIRVVVISGVDVVGCDVVVVVC